MKKKRATMVPRCCKLSILNKPIKNKKKIREGIIQFQKYKYYVPEPGYSKSIENFVEKNSQTLFLYHKQFLCIYFFLSAC